MVLPKVPQIVDPGFHPDGLNSSQSSLVGFAKSLDPHMDHEEMLRIFQHMEIALDSSNEPELTCEEACLVRERVYAVFLHVIGPRLEAPAQRIMEALVERYPACFPE